MAAGVTPLQGAVTAQCTICHASYAVGEAEVNANYLNAELFQPASWRSANGTTTPIFVGNAANPVSALPGVAGITYAGGTPSAMSGAAGSLIISNNVLMKAGGQAFDFVPAPAPTSQSASPTLSSRTRAAPRAQPPQCTG